MNKVAIIIAPNNFQLVEYTETIRALKEKTIEYDSVSTVNEATASDGTKQKTDIFTVDVDATHYKAIILIGGSGSHIYFHDEKMHQLINDFASQGKIVAAICAAPTILAYAGLLHGIKATCFPSHLNDLKSQGAIYTGENVSIDGLIITADGPESAYQFGRLIASKL